MAIGGKTGQETNTLYPFRVSQPHRHHDGKKVPCLFHMGTGSNSGVILIPRLPPASTAESRKGSCSAHRGVSPAAMPAPAGEARSWQGLSWAPTPFFPRGWKLSSVPVFKLQRCPQPTDLTQVRAWKFQVQSVGKVPAFLGHMYVHAWCDVTFVGKAHPLEASFLGGVRWKTLHLPFSSW